MENNYLSAAENFSSQQNSTKEQKEELIQEFLMSISETTKFKFWIKTLLSAYGNMPVIMNAVNKIMSLKASTLSFYSDIYSSETTYSQIENVIDMGERKKRLLNIYLMTKDMIESAPEPTREILELRYNQKYSIEKIASEYGISVRTAYRKIDKAVDELYHFCKSKNWSVRMILSQIKGEKWLVDRFLKIVCDYFKNSNYSMQEKLM